MWQNILKCEKLQTGDVLECNGKILCFNHYAVVFYKGGIPYVTHNTDPGPQIETLESFEKKRTIYNVFRNEVTKKLSDKFIESKAKELEPYGYSFMESNCEDYVKRIVGCYIGLDDRYTFTVVVSLIIITALITTLVLIAKRK